MVVPIIGKKILGSCQSDKNTGRKGTKHKSLMEGFKYILMFIYS